MNLRAWGVFAVGAVAAAAASTTFYYPPETHLLPARETKGRMYLLANYDGNDRWHLTYSTTRYAKWLGEPMEVTFDSEMQTAEARTEYGIFIVEYNWPEIRVDVRSRLRNERTTCVIEKARNENDYVVGEYRVLVLDIDGPLLRTRTGHAARCVTTQIDDV